MIGSGVFVATGFSRRQRLVTNGQIKSVLGWRLRQTDGLLVLHKAENGLAYPRLGVSIGRSCGGAVTRNRLKRLVREAFRLGQHPIEPCFDYVVMISPGGLRRLGREGKALTLQQVQRSLRDLASRGTGRPCRPADEGAAVPDRGHMGGPQEKRS
jgi:ribonuclease P protein component